MQRNAADGLFTKPSIFCYYVQEKVATMVSHTPFFAFPFESQIGPGIEPRRNFNQQLFQLLTSFDCNLFFSPICRLFRRDGYLIKEVFSFPKYAFFRTGSSATTPVIDALIFWVPAKPP